MKFVQSGNIESGKTIVFIHGWPDTPLVWANQLKVLEPTYRCVCLMLPGFDSDFRSFPFFGKKFSDLAVDAANTIKNDVMKGKPADEKVLLIAHDWGANIAYSVLDAEPDLFEKVVTLDIGGHMTPKLGEALFFIAYQWTLVGLYFTPAFIGNPIEKSLAANFFQAPDTHNLNTTMNWIYFSFWWAVFTGSLPKAITTLPKNCPLLFLYGTENKPCMFHSKKWLDDCNSGTGPNAGSAAIGFRGDHWFFLRNQIKDEVNTEIIKFLSR